MSLHTLSLSKQAEILLHGDLPVTELSGHYQRQIEKLNPILNAFITILPPQPDAPSQGPLHGIPIAIKDLYDTCGILTTAGSRFFSDRVPTRDAFVVEKVKQAGALLIGKTNTHEIALGVTNKNPHYGACKNPWNPSRTPGGSSGGSAVAVATGMAAAALGTDTGGSIRIPAALCGVVGLKPTYGRVSLRGVLPLSWNLDHAGPLTRSVEDAALMLQVMAGYDELDAASHKRDTEDFSRSLKKSLQGFRIALAAGAFIEEAESQVLEAVRQAAGVFRQLGASITEVNVDHLQSAALANTLMTQADGAAFHRDRLREHPDWFGADVRARLETGAAYSASDYALARRVQAESRRTCELLLNDYDLLLLPTTPIAAPVIEGEDALQRARQLTRFTAPFNLTGLPALSLPCGFNDEQLPIGLQIVARAWDEASLLQAGFAYQQVTDWHLQIPPMAQ